MRYIILLALLLCSAWPVSIKAQNFQKENVKSMVDTFPVPKENGNLLFYVQRTNNTNTIMYEINYNADSTVNEEEPVKVYWIRYAERGQVAPLSYLQQHYAYGVNTRLMDTSKKTFKVTFVSYKKREIYLIRARDHKKYTAYIAINGKLAAFTRAFVQIDGGTFMLPHIAYVEITGREIGGGRKVIEKFIP